MDPSPTIPVAKDKPLFTPGPLTSSQTVKLAMLRDLGSRDGEFIEIVRQIRQGLLDVAGVTRADGYETVLMQGSGTFGIEAVVGSTVPPDGKLLVIINGSYGQRIAAMAKRLGIATVDLTYPENTAPDPEQVDQALSNDAAIMNVAVVHCETTTGIINPIEQIGQIVARHGRTYFVDSMSAFGAVEFDYQACKIDYLVSSANKCIEGVPGFSFAICRRASLEASRGWARSLSFDLLAQWEGLEKNGQFRFTPPTHTILAFAQALRELQAEGGVAGRAARYQANYQTIVDGMRALGFQEYLTPEQQGYIITSFRYPRDDNFVFETFYNRLAELGFLIYPGKVSDADCFRIGNIGRLFPSDMRTLLPAIQQTLREMDVTLDPQPAGA